MKKRLLIVLAGAMLMACVVAGDAFKYKIVFDSGKIEEAANAFGRLSGADDGLDELDFPIPQRNPGDNAMNYISFRGQPGLNDAWGADVAMLKLSEDYRSTDNNATTWTMDVEIFSASEMIWEAETALTNKDAILELVLPNGTTVDMQKEASLSNPVSGTYLIRYKATEATIEAPEVPALIEKEIAVYKGGSISIKLFDPNDFKIADIDNQYEISFFKGVGSDRKIVDLDPSPDKVVLSTSEGLDYDPETGSLIYTFNTEIDYDEAIIIYRFKKSGTRGADDNSGITVGSIRAVVVEKPVLEMESAPELSVDIKSTEPGANSCTLKYKLDFPGADYQGVDITAESPLAITGKLVLPAWTYKSGKFETCPWTVTASDYKGSEIPVKINYPAEAPVDGTLISNNATFTYNATSNGLGFNFVLTAAAGAKKGNASLSVSCNFPDDATAVALPEDASTTTATISVKGSANLDIDESGAFDLIDVRLLRNYAFGGSAATARGDTTMLSGLSTETYESLPGNDKSEKAAGVRAAITDMVDSLDIDGSGAYDLIDVRLFRNYAFGGSAATARGDTTMLSGLSTETYNNLPGADKSEKAAGVRNAIADMIE